MFGTGLIGYHLQIKQLKLGEHLIVPWSAFTKPKPRDRKERAVSDGVRTYILQPVDSGVMVKRIE